MNIISYDSKTEFAVITTSGRVVYLAPTRDAAEAYRNIKCPPHWSIVEITTSFKKVA